MFVPTTTTTTLLPHETAHGASRSGGAGRETNYTCVYMRGVAPWMSIPRHCVVVHAPILSALHLSLHSPSALTTLKLAALVCRLQGAVRLTLVALLLCIVLGSATMQHSLMFGCPR